jgi:hypothetical protein
MLLDFQVLAGGGGADVYFTQNALLNGGSYACTIRVGNPVAILTQGDPVWDAEAAKAE